MNRLLPLLAAAAAVCGAALSTSALADPAARAQADAYVRRVAAGPNSQPMGRWREPVCPLVSGLPAQEAEYLLQRISTIAREVGVPLGGEQCRSPNLYIVAARDPETLLRSWAERDPGLFGSRREPELERVMRTERPVRVWRRVSFGASNANAAVNQSQALFGVQGQASKPVLNWAGNSHLRGNAARVIWGAVVVLGPEARSLKISQLADYIALTTFAEVNTDADIGGDSSVLGVLRPDGPSKAGLSSSDEAFLKALYRVQPDLVSQRAAISERMAQNVRR